MFADLVDRPASVWQHAGVNSNDWSVTFDPNPSDGGGPTFLATEIRTVSELGADEPNFGWLVSGRLQLQDGAWVVSSLEIGRRWQLPKGGVTSSVLRTIQLGRILQSVMVLASRMALEHQIPPDQLPALPPFAIPPGAENKVLLTEAPAMRRKAQYQSSEAARALMAARRRRATSEDIYRRTALRYLELQEAGERGILNRLADEEGMSYEGIRTRLRTAQRLGYLTHRRQGSRGAQPGPALIRSQERQARE